VKGEKSKYLLNQRKFADGSGLVVGFELTVVEK
jgi:hypothetical protein